MAKKKKRKRQASRKPTYGAATRLARIVYELQGKPFGWSFDAIQDKFDIGERTLLRYLAACRKELVDNDDRPLLEATRQGEARFLRLARRQPSEESSAYDLLMLYFAMAVLQCLDGSVLKQGVQGLWERLRTKLPTPAAARLAHFERKFFSVPYAVKDYTGFDDTLDEIVQALVQQRRLRVDYGGIVGEGKVHEFDPYTLAAYRGGLYVIGHSHRYKKIIWLAVERIRSVERLEKRFDYPENYSPDTYTQGMFGIFEGPETKVELLIRSPETVTYLSSRRLHPTQKFRKRKDGRTVLSMTVRGTTELKAWIMSMGHYVEVLRPKSLRDEMRDALTEARRLYR